MLLKFYGQIVNHIDIQYNKMTSFLIPQQNEALILTRYFLFGIYFILTRYTNSKRFSLKFIDVGILKNEIIIYFIDRILNDNEVK